MNTLAPRTILPFTFTLALLAVPAVALAQEAAPELSAQTEQAGAPAETREHGPRLRLGVTGGGGFGGAVGFGAFYGEISVRAGVQIDDYVAVVYQGTGRLGQEINFCLYSACSSPRTLGMHSSSVLAEVTLGDLFQLRAGPSLGYASGDGQGSGALVGGTFGFAFTFGGRGEGTRQGFSVGAQAELMAAPETDGVSFVVGAMLGWETF